MKLHLGVIEYPYTDATGVTTGDVAEILEAKYHVIELFYQELGDDVSKTLELSAARAIQDLFAGAPPRSVSLTAEAEGEIEAAFRLFLDQRELDGVVPGVPTQAAIRGVNHRLKHPYKKSNPERPSFVDTGTYQQSFKAWSEP